MRAEFYKTDIVLRKLFLLLCNHNFKRDTPEYIAREQELDIARKWARTNGELGIRANMLQQKLNKLKQLI